MQIIIYATLILRIILSSWGKNGVSHTEYGVVYGEIYSSSSTSSPGHGR